MTLDNSPAFEKSKFTCPICSTFSQQYWYQAKIERDDRYKRGHYDAGNIQLCFCDSCEKYSIWRDRKMVFPDTISVAEPNEDLSEGIQDDYREAASILKKSPRGAAALLRLAIQKLCHDLGCDQTAKVNENIKELVSKGLHKKVQQSLDIVRVTGGEAVHPGVLDLRDDEDSVKQLFDLVNLIARQMITEEKEAESIYQKLPASKLAAIEKRDNTSQTHMPPLSTNAPSPKS